MAHHRKVVTNVILAYAKWPMRRQAFGSGYEQHFVEYEGV